MTQLPIPRRTTRHLHRLQELVAQQATLLACINSLVGALMAIDPKVAEEIASLRQAVVDDQASDQGVVDNLDTIITNLKNGQDPTDTIAALEDIKTQIVPVTSQNTPPASAP